MVLLPAAAVLGSVYAHKLYTTLKNKQMYGRRSYKRNYAYGKHRNLPLSLRRKAHKTTKRTTKVPRTLRVSTQSQNVGWWPRIGYSPMPQYKKTVLKYVETIDLSATTGGLTGTSNQFGLNCLFDPNLTGVGHQPMGFDQWAALYKMYHVHQVDIKIRPTEYATGFMYFVAQINNSQDTTAVTGIDFATANERSNCACVNVNADINENVIYKSFRIADIEGNSIIDDNYAATTSGNPGNKPTLNIAAGRFDGGDTGTIKCTVELVFHVKFFQKLTLAPS